MANGKKTQNYKISKKAIHRKENVCINNSLFLILVWSEF